MNICDLPHDILEKIFSYLHLDEVPELTQVCQRFNEVVSSSYALMSTFTVYWSKGQSKLIDMRPLLASVRKYQRMQIEKVVGIKANLQIFLTKHASTLTDVNFFECSFKSSEFASAMKVLEHNLVFLGMCDVNFEVDEGEVAPIKFRRLNYLEIMYGYGEGYSSIINFFTGAMNVQTLMYEDNFEMNMKEAEQFSRFLQSLDSLTNLTLSSNVVQKLFLTEDFNNNVKFKLKMLYIDMNQSPHQSGTSGNAKRIVYDHLCNFISKQSSLEELNIRNAKLSSDRLEFLLNLNVSKLGIVSCCFHQNQKIFVKNSSINTLFLSLNEDIEEDSVEESVVCSLLNNCTEVKKIHFTCTNLTFEMALAIRKCKSNIESLCMFRCSFFPMNIPSLKKLNVSGLVDHEDTINLIRLNTQLKELIVPGCLRHFPKFNQAIEELNLDRLVLN